LGMGIKFEAKGLKVPGYSRKNGRFWEFSEKAVKLLHEYKMEFPAIFKSLEQREESGMTSAKTMFRVANPDVEAKRAHRWLEAKGMLSLHLIPLQADELDKDTVKRVESLLDSLAAQRPSTSIRKAVVKGIPPQAVLKPDHATFKLQEQHFTLGDRVVMVQDAGSVPLGAKGIVVGFHNRVMEVLWDHSFISGTNLSGRCSPYRGLEVPFETCLNLTNPQYVIGTRTKYPAQRGLISVPSRPQRVSSRGEYSTHTGGNAKAKNPVGSQLQSHQARGPNIFHNNQGGNGPTQPYQSQSHIRRL